MARRQARKSPAHEPTAEDFLPLPVAHFHVLVTLTGGEKHGYAIMREVDDLSRGSVRMGPGTLYGTLKKLVDQGLLEEVAGSSDSVGDDRRRYYRLSGLGQRVCASESDRLARLVRVARSNLRPGLT